MIEVLTAFIREHSREQWPPLDSGGREPERLTPPDVQAAVTVVGRRDVKRDIRRIDLDRGANLTGATLTGAALTGAALIGAALTGAALGRADLTGATLTGADLTGAALTCADLTYADLTCADLTYADLSGATLTGAGLGRGPHRRQVARRYASSGRLETRYRLWSAEAGGRLTQGRQRRTSLVFS